MTRTVDYYFSLMSPWTYLGHARLCAMAERHGAEIRFFPIELRTVFAASGGVPVAKRAPSRQRYRMWELKRWKRRLGVPLTLEPKFFPTDTGPASRVVIAAMDAGHDPAALSEAIMRAIWYEDRDISNAETLRAILTQQSIDADAILAQAEAPECQERLDAFTQQALDNDVFGAPTYIVAGEPFWGQDRLDFVEEALSDR